MEGKITVFDVFKGCLLLIAGFFIAYFGAFFVTMTEHVKEYAYPQAYGRTTLQPKTDGIGTVLVWQKNYIPFGGPDPEEVTLNHERLRNSKDYYFQLELPMVPGNTMLPYAQIGENSPEWAQVKRNITYDAQFAAVYYKEFYERGYSDDILTEYPFSIVHTGRITGHLDLAPSSFYYLPNRDAVPGVFFECPVSPHTEDGTFEGRDSITVSVPAISVSYTDYYTGKSNKTPREYYKDWADRYVLSDDFEFDSFYSLEMFTDVYPGAPEILWEFERSVLTRRLYFELYSPTDSDMKIADGVILIRTYGTWQKPYASSAEINAITHYGYQNEEYTEFIVEKYTQSEMHSLK
ncbi:MAG: hypothetical protein IJ037_03510 [Clostridia bacterium]|nr:hypothetical protein [Clostridia bacterium]